MADEHQVSRAMQETAHEADDAEHQVSRGMQETAHAAPAGQHQTSRLIQETAHEMPGGQHQASRLMQETAHGVSVAEHQLSRFMQETAHFLQLPHLTDAIPQIAPTDGAKGAALIPIVEIDLSSTLKFSSVGVPTDEGHYEAGVLSWGSFLRELPEQSGEFRVSEGQITFQNADNRWGKLRATETILESAVRIKVGDPSGPVADFTTIYSGTVTDWNLRPAEFSITVTDPWTRFLDRILFIPITTFTFPFLPDSTPSGGMVPIVAGIHETSGHERKGAVPAHLIDPTFTHVVLGANKFRYVACQGKIEDITAVYIYGELATEGSGDDYVWDDEDEENLFAVPDTVNYITFNADPRLGLGGTIPDGADTSIPEVTFDVKGLVNESIGGVTAMENPAEVLDFVLRKHAKSFTDAVLELQTIDDSINQASVTKATLEYIRNNLKIAFWVTDVNSTVREILNRFSESTGLTLVSRKDGSLSFVVQTKKVESPGFKPWLIESTHTFEEGFEVTKADRVVAVLTTNYNYDIVKGSFTETDVDQTMHGGTRGHGEADEINLWYVRDAGSKSVATEEFLFRAQEDRQIAAVNIDPNLVRTLTGFKTSIEVGEVIALTHSSVPSSDGLGSRAGFYRILSVAPNLDVPMSMSIRLQDLLAFTKSSTNQRFLEIGRIIGSHLFAVDHERLIGAVGPLQDSTRIDPLGRQF
jgi:hypothetical protein